MKVGKGELNLLIGLLGVLAAVAMWFFYTSPTMDETDMLKNENVALKARAEEYQAVHARVDEYSNGILDFEVEKADIMTHYPSTIKSEDAVMFWANVDNAYPSELALRDLELKPLDAVVVEGASEEMTEIAYDENGNIIIPENIASQYRLYGVPVSMQMVSTYTGMKDLFEYINAQYEKNAINFFEVYFDESTGNLNGSIEAEMYYIAGQEDAPNANSFIPSVPTGQADVFHTGLTGIEAINDATDVTSLEADETEE